LLPADTVAVAWIDDAVALADALGRTAVLDGFAAELAMLPHFIGGGDGSAALDPVRLEELGIDPHRPLGVAFVRQESAGVLFAAVTDEGRFVRALEEEVGQPINMVGTHGGRIGESADVGVAVRDGWALVVVGEEDESIRQLARRIVDAHPRDSLAATAGFRRARQPDPAPLEIFVAVDEVLRMAEAELTGRTGVELTWLEREISAARERGAPSGEVESLERELEQMRVSDQRRRAEDRRVMDALHHVVGGVHGFDVRFTLAPHWIEWSGRLDVDDDTLLRRLFRRVEAGSAAMRVLDGTPVLGLGVAWDPAALEELVRLMLDAGGTTLAALSDDAERELGIRLDEVLAVSAGTAELTMGYTRPIQLGVGWPKGLDWTATIGVNDGAPVRGILDRFAARTPEVDRRGRDWTASLGGGPSATVRLLPSRLVMATDRKRLGRYASATPGSARAALSSEVATWWDDPALAGRAMLSARLIALLAPRVDYRAEASDTLTRADWRFDLSDAERDRIPKSREFKRRAAAARKTLARVRTLEAREQMLAGERDFELAGLVGGLHLVGQPSPSGYELHGGWRFAGATLGETAAQLKAEYERTRDLTRRHESELQDAWAKLAEDMTRVDEARISDVERWLVAQGRSTQTRW
jgi:hypothetical protein